MHRPIQKYAKKVKRFTFSRTPRKKRGNLEHFEFKRVNVHVKEKHAK